VNAGAIKKLNGVELNGVALAQLAIKYVEAANSDRPINIYDSWDSIVSGEYERLLADAKNVFLDEISGFRSDLPMEESGVTQKLLAAKKVALQVFSSNMMRNETLERQY
jgi:hypothetical protein